MNASEFVDLVIEHVGDELTRPRAYTYINAAQNKFLAKRTRLMRILPDPFVVTVAGTFRYQASSALYSADGGVLGSAVYAVRDVARVYTLNGGDNAALYPSSTRRQEEPDDGSDAYKVPVDVTPSVGGADCSIVFREDYDPGTSTITYRAEAYRWPTQFTSEGVALEMPEDFQSTLLLWEVLQRLGVRQYGAPSKNIYQLVTDEEKRFKNFCSTLTQANPARTQPRGW